MDKTTMIRNLTTAQDWIEDAHATKSFAQEALHLVEARKELSKVLEAIDARIAEVGPTAD